MVTDDGYIPTAPQNLDTKQGVQFDSNDYDLPQVGGILLDKYRVTAKVETGGFGIVLYVIDLSTRVEYAVKTYKSKLAISDNEKFIEEANFLINFGSHMNIVNAHLVEVVDGRPYLFMEYVQGTTLRDRIGQLATPQAVELAYQICLGMEFINKRGETVHADLKPENILISRGNIAKIIDFGISKAYDFMSGVFPRQSTGTIPYKSPEQLNGEVLRQTSDIFSFGILFFEMLTGQFPYPFSLKELGWFRNKLTL